MTGLIITLGFVIFCFYMARKTYKRQKEQKGKLTIPGENPNLSDYKKVQFNFDMSEQTAPPKATGELRKVSEGWVINSGMPFELTILDCTKELAQRIKELCEDGYYKAEKEMLVLFATHNIKVKEIEEYKQKYRKTFFDRYEQLRRESTEYQNADPQDRADMDEEFFQQAQDSLYELASYDAYKLFCSYDMTIDDEFLQEYGFDVLNAYFSYANKIGKVAVIGKDNYCRAAFEKMAETGLAFRGKDIPLEELLTSQTLKTLNEIADNPEKEFKRKYQAIEYIIAHPEKQEKLGEYISFRELFKLLPLPEKYANLDLDQVRMMWDCHREEARILLLTYSHAQYSARDLHQAKEYHGNEPYVFRVSASNEQCKCAKDMEKQKFPRNNPPKVPCHVGCNCWLKTTQN
ncbi:MAG: hypothetical protein IJ785_02000 [Bacteroidales bacterium]|nr:hypothetical protein [Bacteroidales bacterium]